MKYIAIFDDNELTEAEKLNLSFLHAKNDGSVRMIEIKPIFKNMVVTVEGESTYIRQEHIDCLIKFEQEEMIKAEIKRHNNFINILRGKDNG